MWGRANVHYGKSAQTLVRVSNALVWFGERGNHCSSGPSRRRRYLPTCARGARLRLVVKSLLEVGKQISPRYRGFSRKVALNCLVELFKGWHHYFYGD